MRAKLALLFVSSLIALALAEFLARTLVPAEPMVRFSELAEAASIEGEDAGAGVSELFVADYELFWKLGPDRVRPDNAEGAFRGRISNAKGLRDAREIPYDKPNKELRVLFLGDSTSFGWGLRPDETVAFQVELGLREHFPEMTLVCLNTGVPGYTLYQGVRYLQIEGLRYQPDLVISSFGFNDQVNWRNRTDHEMSVYQKAIAPPKGLAWSHLVSLAFKSLHPLPVASTDRRRDRVPDEDFEELLLELAEITDSRDIGLLLLVGGRRLNVDGTNTAAMRDRLQYLQYFFGVEHPFGIPPEPGHLDTVPMMQSLSAEHGIEAVYMDRVHPTAFANKAVAAALVDRIKPWLRTKVKY